MTRQAWIALGAAVAALGALAVVLERRPPAGSTPGGPLLPGFERERALKIDIKGKTPEESILLEKQSGGWAVPAEKNYPADPEGVRELLDFLTSVRAASKVSENPDKRAIYEVDASGLAVRVSGAEDAVLAHLVVGKMGPDFLSTYLRLEGSDAVYLIDQSLRRLFVRPGPRQWRDKAVFRLAAPDITRLKWTREGKTVALEADAGGSWTMSAPGTAPARADEVEEVRKALAALQCDDFAEGTSQKQSRLDSPWGRLELALRDGTTHTLEVGAENERSQRYARRSGNDTLFLINNFRINNIFRSAEELKAPPPEPGAAAAPGGSPASAPDQPAN